AAHAALRLNQFGRHGRRAIELMVGPAVDDRHVLALGIARLLEGLAEYQHARRIRLRRLAAEEPDHRHRLLRARDRRREHRRAADERHEFPPPHSITSSARSSSAVGTVRPRAAAVLKLIANANWPGCWTGRSAGLAPWRMRST